MLRMRDLRGPDGLELDEDDLRDLVLELAGMPLLDVRDVARHLGVSVKGIQVACQTRQIPHMEWSKVRTPSGRRGRYKYCFSLEHLQEIKRRMTVDPEPREGE